MSSRECANRYRASTLVATLSLLAMTLTGCAVPEVRPGIQSCSPSYVVQSKFGRFSAQQAGRGYPIPWGAHPSPTYTGNWYRIKVYAGGVKIDDKNQNYPPHGMMGGPRALKYSGKIFEFSGDVTRAGKIVLVFDLRCRIA
ncbi:MAG: hypothetical protein JWR52_1398 [Marmoricola sp.]|nr:hypothetical protein [Marmoricola sp.]